MDETNDPIEPKSEDEALEEAFTFDPIPETPDKEADARKLQEELTRYQKALQEEWETDERYKEGQLSPTAIREKTKELLTQGVPKAVAGMLHLAVHARSETVALQAQKFIIERAIGKEGTGLVGDPLEALLANLQKDREPQES